MGNKSSLMLQDEEIKQIGEETGFSASQIEKLYSRFAQLDRASCGTLTKADLISIPELAINPLCDRLIEMFFADCEPDDERINFRQFMRILSTFRPSTSSNDNKIPDKNSDDQQMKRTKAHSLGAPQTSDNNNPASRQQQQDLNEQNHGRFRNQSLRNKLLFVFKVYDADDDGRISFNDLRHILKMMVGNYIEEVQLDKIATRAFVEVDEDGDGFIEFDEFCKVFSGKDLDDKLRVKFFN